MLRCAVIAQGSAVLGAEDAELQRAIAASMGVDEGTAVPMEGSQEQALSLEGEEEEERQIMEAIRLQAEAAARLAPSAAHVAAEAAARLPQESAGSEGCRIAVRLPGGGREQRRFPRSAPVAAVRDWCLTLCEEAAGGRPFSLSQAMPGAAPLSDVQQSLEAANLADSMLVLKWDS